MTNIIRNFSFLAMAFFFSACQGCDFGPAGNDTGGGTKNYSLAWSDEFSGTTLDSTKWTPSIGYGDWGWGNDEWQNYTSDSANIKIEDGSLVLSALLSTETPGKRDGSVTSGKVTTQGKFSFKYGKIQARIKAPFGQGVWPAFWMLGNSISSVGWPACGEIDILEMWSGTSDAKTAHSTIHWSNSSNVHAYTGDSISFSENLTDDYHIYEIEWDSRSLTARVDGTAFFTQSITSSDRSEFHGEFFLLLNVAIGGNLPGAPDETTAWPQEMRIDWIRVYQE